MLTGTTNNEDAAVFRINDEMALVQTLDFITPVVDDPFLYGQIAAANSLSDVFAMGGKVLNALNIVGFDSCNLTSEILNEIMAGGASKVGECGGVVIGGHSIETAEMYYGLSVTGVVRPDAFWANNTAKIGDTLILTKPLGTGILATAIKADLLNMTQIAEAVDIMAMLNFYATKALDDIKVHACTDITGFGLLGHLSEMLNDNISFEIFTQNIPLISSAVDMANMGIIPEGSYRNREFAKNFVNNDDFDILLCDAQTSGGLLIAVSQNNANKALKRLIDIGYTRAQIIGITKENNQEKRIILS